MMKRKKVKKPEIIAKYKKQAPRNSRNDMLNSSKVSNASTSKKRGTSKKKVIKPRPNGMQVVNISNIAESYQSTSKKAQNRSFQFDQDINPLDSSKFELTD